ncbi:MAG TPA: DUF4347 domain-containing protein, partial [Cellvibrio sp.]
MSTSCFALERSEIIYVDPHVDDSQQLIDAMPRAARVVMLDANKNGFKQIADDLAVQSDVDAIHLISHGRAGAVQAGDSWLSAQTIAENSGSLKRIGELLGPNGDFLL